MDFQDFSHALGAQFFLLRPLTRGHSTGRVPSDASAVAGANEVHEGWERLDNRHVYCYNYIVYIYEIIYNYIIYIYIVYILYTYISIRYRYV